MDFFTELCEFKARLEVPVVDQVKWKVQAQLRSTWTVYLKVGGPYVDQLPELTWEFLYFL